MNRNYLTGLLLAAATMTVGTFAVVSAQDGAAPDAEKPHGHEHTPTTVHAGDESAFALDDEKAYPDPDGFKSMDERISYALGRSIAPQIPIAEEDLNMETFGEGIKKGISEKNEDYAVGYSQGFTMARRIVDSMPEDTDLDAFVAGLSAAIKEKDQGKAIGYLLGNNYREADLPFSTDTYIKGVNEGIEAAKPPVKVEGEGPDPIENEPAKLALTEEQVMETLQALDAFINAKQVKEAIAEGTDFIAELKAEDGWKKTESGIAYKVVEAGEGESPDANDVVTMDYAGTLIDDTEFDSSYSRDQKLVIPANRVIPGWTEVLQMMKPGAVYEVVIPYNLAYGEGGSPPRIPGYAALKFKMQMHSFESVENPPAKKDVVQEKKADE